MRDYQRESYQFRVKLGRLRQLRLNNGHLGLGHGGQGLNINNFIDKNTLRYNFQTQDANEIMDGVKTDDGDGDGAEKTTDKDDLNDTKVDKNEKSEKEKKRQAFRGKYI